MELDSIKKDPEDFITDLDELRTKMERDLGAELLTNENLKKRGRSKYRRLTKKMDINEDEIALNAK